MKDLEICNGCTRACDDGHVCIHGSEFYPGKPKLQTNADRIRNMSDEELAYFINLDHPNCNEICPDATAGCAFKCKHKAGELVILDWLRQEATQ